MGRMRNSARRLLMIGGLLLGTLLPATSVAPAHADAPNTWSSVASMPTARSGPCCGGSPGRPHLRSRRPKQHGSCSAHLGSILARQQHLDESRPDEHWSLRPWSGGRFRRARLCHRRHQRRHRHQFRRGLHPWHQYLGGSGSDAHCPLLCRRRHWTGRPDLRHWRRLHGANREHSPAQYRRGIHAEHQHLGDGSLDANGPQRNPGGGAGTGWPHLRHWRRPIRYCTNPGGGVRTVHGYVVIGCLPAGATGISWGSDRR